jgi:hypothetical protein
MKTFLKIIAPIAIVAVVVTIVVSVFENKQYDVDETEDDDCGDCDSNCPYEIE